MEMHSITYKGKTIWDKLTFYHIYQFLFLLLKIIYLQIMNFFKLKLQLSILISVESR